VFGFLILFTFGRIGKPDYSINFKLIMKKVFEINK